MEEKDLIDIIKNTQFLSNKTKNMYLKKIDLIKKMFDKNLSNVIQNPDNFSEMIGGVCKNAHTTMTFYAPIMAIFNHGIKEKYPDLFNKWNKCFNVANEPITTKYLSNKPTERQSKSYVSYDEIVKVRDSLKIGSQEKLILCFYTMIPPMRADYYSTRIGEITNDNYILLKPPIIVLNKYKTAKTYGKIQIDIPVELLSELKISLKKNPRKYLFVSPKDFQPFKSAGSYDKYCNKFLKKLFGEGMSLTFLRHIYISRPDLDLKSKTGIEKNKVAKMMGHSVTQQSKYLWI